MLKEENKLLREELQQTKEKLTLVERDVIQLQQYDRRNNLEIVGIPSDVSQENLEKKVIDLFDVLGETVNSNEIEACHRLKQKPRDKGPPRTIIRFVNRKKAECLLRKNKELRNKDLTKINLDSQNLYINCNLRPYNRMLWGKCKELYKQNRITKFWVYNGIINVKTSNETRHRINHIDDLDNLLENDN